ncbi:hypothetical protein ACGFIF_27900 [Kribbella sp. NPDC049174]|uniref:hypothetical protein n=1 Tax=Kribbella sp. NPDC049174 TaxID=3364112 RepID=UPI00372162CF
MAPLLPIRVRVRMYQVGFGDCFLMTVEYAADGNKRTERNILFDFGTTHGPRSGPVKMAVIADLIEEHTKGKLDVLVITHRHRDHLRAFGTTASAEVMRRLPPKLVLRPWTEDPDLQADATGPTDGAGLVARRFVAQLTEAQAAVKRIAARPAPPRGALHDLRAAAADEVPDQEAISTLDQLAADPRGRYLHADKPCLLGNVVPGLRITVLGPPTVEQHPRVAGQATSDPEYWMLRLQRSLTAAAPREDSTAPPEPPGAEGSIPPGPVRWLVEHLAKHRTHSTARLVRALDTAMNNTSLILLLEVGRLKMLFSGDAQIENWEYTLGKLANDHELTAKLTGLDLYKVGHHGSRNATPRSLHALWAQRPAGAPPMTTLMSTRPGVHGESAKTAVPRETLVTALKEVSTLHSTDDFPRGTLFLELTADTTGGPFEPV